MGGFDPPDPRPTLAELWDTVTNEIINIPHPPELHNQTVFRPTVITYNDSAILVVNGGPSHQDNTDNRMASIWTYDINHGWSDMGLIPPGIREPNQNGLIALDDPSIHGFESLSKCLKISPLESTTDDTLVF